MLPTSVAPLTDKNQAVNGRPVCGSESGSRQPFAQILVATLKYLLRREEESISIFFGFTLNPGVTFGDDIVPTVPINGIDGIATAAGIFLSAKFVGAHNIASPGPHHLFRP